MFIILFLLCLTCWFSSTSAVSAVAPGDAECQNENDNFNENDCILSKGEIMNGQCETCFDPSFLENHFGITTPPNGDTNGEVIVEINNWLGHRVTGQMFRILLQEIFGYAYTQE